MITENGSGGSRIGVKTTFEDADDGRDYKRSLAEVRLKVDDVYVNLGKTAITEDMPRPIITDWLGLSAIRPQLDLPTLDEVTRPYLPDPEIRSQRDQHN